MTDLIKYISILRNRVMGIVGILKNSLTTDILVARRQYRKDIEYKPEKPLLRLSVKNDKGKEKW